VAVIVVLVIGYLGFRFMQNRSQVSTAVIGDSITDISRTTFEQALEPDYAVEVDGVGGARVDQMQGEADKVAATHPQQVVINLGTNDVIGKFPIDQSMKSYEEMINKFPDAACLHVVTVNEDIVALSDPDYRNRAVEYNNRLRSLASQHHARVIEWNRIVHDYLAAGEPEGHLSTDSIHPTELGQKKLADAYRASLDACRNSIV
jgi:lysophospholipase L1-like esterase